MTKLAFGLWLMPDAVRPQLEAGETPLAWERLLQTVTDDRIGKASKGKTVTGFSFDPFAGGIQTDDGFIERTLGGVSATGPAGSAAAAWAGALDGGTGQHLLLTDRRLLLVDHNSRTDVRVRVAIPRAAVSDVRRKPRLLAASRVRFTFADGSTIAVTSAMLWFRPANRIVRAWRTGQPQNPR